jgi:hypothetical protein
LHVDAPERSGEVKHSIARRILAVSLVIFFVAGAATIALLASSHSGPTVLTSAISTYYPTSPNAIVSAAVQVNPAGYTLESSKEGPPTTGQQGGDWAVLGQPDGSLANMTVEVYASTNASQSYFNRLVGNLKALPGYTDITSALSSYEKYGSCYGYGEDVDGTAVANGVCTKGNVVLQLHLVSSKALSDLQSDMTSLMAALYDNTD